MQSVCTSMVVLFYFYEKKKVKYFGSLFCRRYRAGNNNGAKQEEIFNCADIEIKEDPNKKAGGLNATLSETTAFENVVSTTKRNCSVLKQSNLFICFVFILIVVFVVKI